MQRDLPLHGIDAPAWRAWLDALIEREVLRLRARYELSLDELRGLYISDAQVDALLHERLGSEGSPDPAALLSARAQALAPRHESGTALSALGHRLGLAQSELDLLCLALAPELDPRYETLYAYLNNDITRRQLTLDLAQRLLSGARADVPDPDVQALLIPAAALLASGAVQRFEAAEHRSAWQHGLSAAPVVVQFCRGLPLIDARWPPEVRWHAPGARPQRPIEVLEPLILISADDAEDRLTAACDWTAARGVPLLHAPASMLAQDGSGALARSLPLAARLACAALALDDDRSEPLNAARLRALMVPGVPLLLLGTPASPWAATLTEWAHRRIDVAPPDLSQRLALWRAATRDRGLVLPESALQALAERHVLGAARIRAAATTAAWSHAGVAAPPDAAALHASLDAEAAARANHVLARLATRVQREHHWQQLVLAENTTRQLREIADAIRVREQVYRGWGMQQRTGRSAGLMMLFCGASGTGKTMAASVVSNAAGLALYRIDLASVVSKYIGETEQNLDRIFRAAQHASAVLLFDEADALLGRRSEVKDAHDRYANLEVAYLLQKMEDHDGVVMLSSNLPKNLDSAFARRMHYTVEFGRPNAALRERLWRGMFAAGVPLAADIDHAFLAERFETTGGEIQAIALDAAFLAAADAHPVSMQHIMHALSRRQTQQGNAAGMGRYREHAGRTAAQPPG